MKSLLEAKEFQQYSSNILKNSPKYDPSLVKISEKTFPKIFLTRRLSDNYPVFLKIFQFEEKALFEAFLSEIQQSLQNINRVYQNILDFFVLKDKRPFPFELYLFLERAEFSLNDLISNISENIPKPEQELLQIYSDLATSLQSAHQSNFAHGSIHPNNILVFCPGKERPVESQKFNVFTQNIYKINDWRFDYILQGQKKKENNQDIWAKNSAFRPPEFFDGGQQNLKALDVYSLAMCMLNCCGVPLKRMLPISISEEEIHDLQLAKIFNEIAQNYDYKFIEILKMSLMYDAAKRWTIENVVFALKNLSKCSTGAFETANNEIQEEKKEKKGILKKMFSGIFKSKKNKNGVNGKNEANQFQQNSITDSLFEFNYNSKYVALQAFCKEDYSNLSTHKQSKGTSTELNNIWRNIHPQTLNALKLEFRTENNFGMENLDFYENVLKEKAKIQETARVSLISTSEKVGGDLGHFLSKFYFSNELMEGENSLFENTFNLVHYFQKNQNAGLSNEELIILMKSLKNLEKKNLKSLNIIVKSYEKLADEPLKCAGALLHSLAENLREFNFFFTGQNISDEGVNSIAKSLSDSITKHHNLELKKLGLGFGGKKKITDASLIDISKTLITLSTRVDLSKLYLYFNSFEITNEGLDSLGTAIGNLSKTLKELTIFLITWEQITDQGVLLLFRELLLKSKKLSRITVGIKSVGLTCEGIGILFGLLAKTESKLQHLNVYYEQMSNRNIVLEREFKEKLQKIHTELTFGEIYIKV